MTAIKPEAPTDLADNRPEGYDPLPGKVYDQHGNIPRLYEKSNVGPGVNNDAQNYANGLDMLSVARVDKIPDKFTTPDTFLVGKLHKRILP